MKKDVLLWSQLEPMLKVGDLKDMIFFLEKTK